MAQTREKRIEGLALTHDPNAAVSDYIDLAVEFYRHDHLFVAGTSEKTAVVPALVPHFTVCGYLG